MIPLIELKGGIPIGVNNYGLSYGEAFLYAFLGSSIVCIPLYWLCKLLFRVKFFKRVETIFRRKAAKLFLKTEGLQQSNASPKKVTFYKCLGVFIFAVLPIPLTGVWSATLIAVLVGLKFRYTVPVIFAGNAASGGMILGLTALLGKENLDIFILVLFGVCLVLLALLLWRLFRRDKVRDTTPAS